MPLFTVRPSRGAWAFFALVALAAAGARGYDRRERTIARRDGPVAGDALNLARCVFGQDAVWLLDDTGLTDRQGVWSRRMADWLRDTATIPQAPNWPARCAPLAEHLATRLDATPAAPERSASVARTVASDLQSLTRDRFALLNAVDGDGLSDRLAGLLAQVRGMSSGAVGRWDHEAPVTLSDLGHVRQVRLARWVPLAPGAERPVLVSASVVLYRSPADGGLHHLEVDASGRRETLLAAALPLREPSHGDLARAEADGGPYLVLSTPSPRVVPFPEALARGDEAVGPWESALTPEVIALLTDDKGSLSLRTTPRDGAAVWSGPWAVGPGESALGAVVAPEPMGDAEALRVSVLRPRVDDAVLEQYLVPPGTDPSVALAATSVVTTPGVPAFGARVTTCSAGSVRYLVVAAESVLTTLRVAGPVVRTAQATGVWARGRTLTVTCDEHRAVVGTDPTSARGAYQLFDFVHPGAPSTVVLEPPLVGPAARVEAVALTGGDVVAVESNRATLRTYILESRGGTWRVGGLVALLTPAPGPVRTLTRVTALGSARQLTLLLEGTGSPWPPSERPHDDNAPADNPDDDTATRQRLVTPFVSLLVSTDRGVTFTAP